ncbi:MAG: Stp1/IreP family PP2C-type Ser/Thr phosphatase [Thiohalocapsa sp.]|nr:Stp1/IreP family PP2C-type Ser/Thr phosphatase [Thiohalocapsa sp.]
MPAPRLHFAWRTDRGLVRARNEDAVDVQPALGLAVVADGMGGANAGDVASKLAVGMISERLLEASARERGDRPTGARSAAALLRSAVADANSAILETAARDPSCSGMGTTVVAGLFTHDWLAVAHVGDSRLYRLRDGQLQQLTRDHSFIQELVDRGLYASVEEASSQGISDSLLTRAVGIDATLEVSSSVSAVEAGDRYLLCTDGLTGMLSDEDIASLIVAAGDALDAAAEALVERACANGGTDNITVALVGVESVSCG